MSAQDSLSPIQFHMVDYSLADDPAFGASYHAVQAFKSDSDEQIGNLTWKARAGGEIAGIHVDPKYRRLGIATAMLKHAETIAPVTHAKKVSPEAEAWIQGMNK